MKIRHSNKSFRSKSPKRTQTSSSDNLLFSPRELKQMHRSEIRSKILKVALPCLLVAVIGTAAYAMQSKAHHLPNNSLTDTSGISSLSNVPNSTSSSQSSIPTSTNTSESTNSASTNGQTTNGSNLQAQLNAIQAKATDSVNAAEAQANADAAQAATSIQANNTAIAQEQAQATADEAQAKADLANANNPAMTPAEQAEAAASAAQLQCIAQTVGQLAAANDQLDAQAGTMGFNAAAAANNESEYTSNLARCNNQ